MICATRWVSANGHSKRLPSLNLENLRIDLLEPYVVFVGTLFSSSRGWEDFSTLLNDHLASEWACFGNSTSFLDSDRAFQNSFKICNHTRRHSF